MLLSAFYSSFQLFITASLSWNFPCWVSASSGFILACFGCFVLYYYLFALFLESSIYNNQANYKDEFMGEYTVLSITNVIISLNGF